MVKQKAKGTKGERELIRLFNEAGWSAIRAAGSGSSPYPAPDVLAGNAQRRVAIECKVTKETKKYFPKEEIEQLKAFSQKFGAESWIGLRFSRQPWYFVLPEDLEKTGNLWAISLEAAQRKGVRVEELLGGDSTDNRNI